MVIGRYQLNTSLWWKAGNGDRFQSILKPLTDCPRERILTRFTHRPEQGPQNVSQRKPTASTWGVWRRKLERLSLDSHVVESTELLNNGHIPISQFWLTFHATSIIDHTATQPTASHLSVKFPTHCHLMKGPLKPLRPIYGLVGTAKSNDITQQLSGRRYLNTRTENQLPSTVGACYVLFREETPN